MSWFSVKKKVDTPAEKKLEEIRDLLFPKNESRETVDKTGEEVKYQVDYSADMNLDAALIDIQEGYVDEVVENTIRDVSNRLYKVREVLNAWQEIDHDSNYIIYESKKSDLDLENIDIFE